MNNSLNKLLFYVWGFVLISCSASTSTFAACDYVIGVGTAYPNIGNLPYNAIAAGSTVCIKPGVYNEMLIINKVQGTSAKTTTFQPYNPKILPVITGGVLIRSSSYVTMSGVSASAPASNSPAAILIDGGSHHVLVQNSIAENSTHGIELGGIADAGGSGGPAGNSNTIKNNIVRNNRYFGIAIANHSNGTIDRQNLVINNIVSGNGLHGIDIDTSSYIRVESNIVTSNGVKAGGSSGIHIFAPKDIKGSCDYNTITKNTVSLQQDRYLYDGNGIQVDHFCDYNTVSFNIIKRNDGAGISLYTSSYNQVYNNTVSGNGLQSNLVKNRPPKYNPVGEITVSTCQVAGGCIDNLPHPGRAHDNKIYNNTITPTVKGMPGINIDSSAYTNNNTTRSNTYNLSSKVLDSVALYINGIPYSSDLR